MKGGESLPTQIEDGEVTSVDEVEVLLDEVTSARDFDFSDNSSEEERKLQGSEGHISKEVRDLLELSKWERPANEKRVSRPVDRLSFLSCGLVYEQAVRSRPKEAKEALVKELTSMMDKGVFHPVRKQDIGSANEKYIRKA